MSRVLIVGFGNPLRSDDGLGWHVALELSRKLSGSDVQVVAAHQLTPDLAEVASRAELVLFVDAACNKTPGTLNCEPIDPAASPGRYSHELSPGMVLTLANELYGRCPPAHLLTIAGESFETGETMSPSVVAAIPDLIARIKQFVDCG
jgi:hydrogenase maturation protease